MLLQRSVPRTVYWVGSPLMPMIVDLIEAMHNLQCLSYAPIRTVEMM